MKIFHIASELAPLAKIGGLGDVTLGLSRELSWKGHDISIIIPKYDCINTQEIQDFAVHTSDLLSYYEGKYFSNTIWMGWVENLKVFFIEPHHPRMFFNRGCIYGCEDDVERYLYFSRCCLEFIAATPDLSPDIIHIHDWQTAAIAPLYPEIFKEKPAKIVFTIHNLEHQGKCSPKNIDAIGLSGKAMIAKNKMQDPYYPETINLLKGAIVYSDFITTVSPNYAWEITTEVGGRGLDSTINQHSHKFCGILNGIDYAYWNPEIDRYLPSHFSERELPKNKKDHDILDTKAFLKKELRERLSLAEEHRPIVGCVTRIVPQKGIEMIKHVITTIADRGGQFVLLGSSPIPAINEEFHRLKAKFRDHPHVFLILHHQEELAHLIFAGTDMFIVPSLFEPCGLTQLIAMKYGSIPIVRNTGGLSDTVFDIDYSPIPEEQRNGYMFNQADNQGIDSALDRAMECWYDRPDKWRQLMIRAMTMDYSWNKPADKYLEIYKKLMEKEV